MTLLKLNFSRLYHKDLKVIKYFQYNLFFNLKESILFRVVLPKTQEELKKYYQFRYKIMCEELGHIEKNKNNIDIDEYDKHSLHLMAINNCQVSPRCTN